MYSIKVAGIPRSSRGVLLKFCHANNLAGICYNEDSNSEVWDRDRDPVI